MFSPVRITRANGYDKRCRARGSLTSVYDGRLTADTLPFFALQP